MRRLGRAALASLAVMAVLSCRAGSRAAPAGAAAAVPAAWPTKSWQVSPPEAQGVDGPALAAAADAIAEGGWGIRSLLVVRHGYLVGEYYFEGGDKDALADLYSVTKSVVSTLCGIAIDQGKIAGVRAPLSDFLDYGSLRNPDPRKQAIVLEDLLTMRSGLDWTEGGAAYSSFYAGGDPVASVAGERMRAAPGTAFNYDSGAVHLLSAALAKATGEQAASYAKRFLFGPLGIKRFEWEKDPRGLSVGGWGLRMTSRDMAKLGLLMLRDGAWEGRQVVSKAWVDAATGPRVPDTGSAEGLGYGYLWWVYPAVGGYVALGYDGQAILVVPGKDLVVVVTASTPDHGHGAIFPILAGRIVPAAR